MATIKDCADACVLFNRSLDTLGKHILYKYNQVTMEEVMPKYYCGYVDVVKPIRVNILGVEHFIPVGQRIAVTVHGDLAIAHGYQEACFFVDGKIIERGEN